MSQSHNVSELRSRARALVVATGLNKDFPNVGAEFLDKIKKLHSTGITSAEIVLAVEHINANPGYVPGPMDAQQPSSRKPVTVDVSSIAKNLDFWRKWHLDDVLREDLAELLRDGDDVTKWVNENLVPAMEATDLFKSKPAGTRIVVKTGVISRDDNAGVKSRINDLYESMSPTQKSCFVAEPTEVVGSGFYLDVRGLRIFSPVKKCVVQAARYISCMGDDDFTIAQVTATGIQVEGVAQAVGVGVNAATGATIAPAAGLPGPPAVVTPGVSGGNSTSGSGLGSSGTSNQQTPSGSGDSSAGASSGEPPGTSSRDSGKGAKKDQNKAAEKLSG